ncbi:MAG: ABC transporter ATP-binding protein [Bacteroidales bacterium]
MNDVVIDLQHVTKKYGDFTAVNDLSLQVSKGEIFGLLGPNGAGKSTSILMMLGLTEPTSGNVEINNINSALNPIEVKKHVGYLPEDVGFYNDMTAKENLMFTARLNSLNDDEAIEKVDELLNLVGLSSVANKKLGKFSKGMRQRLGLADVLVKDPNVIILDEPTSAIDPEGVKEMLSLILKLRDERQMTILFSSHNLHQVQQVCDRVGIFVKGQLLAQGDISELSEQLFGREGCSLDEIYSRYFETKVI